MNAAASEIGVKKAFLKAKDAAKALMRGEAVPAKKFTEWAKTFKRHQPLVDLMEQLADITKSESHAKRVKNAQLRAKADRQVDMANDDLMTAIAKLGGISKAQAQSEFGIDPADMGAHGHRLLRSFTSNGRLLDDMRETLAQYGYPVGDTKASFGDAIADAMSGNRVLTPDGIEAQVADDIQQAYDQLTDGEQDAFDRAYQAVTELIVNGLALGRKGADEIYAKVAAHYSAESGANIDRKATEAFNAIIERARKNSGGNSEASVIHGNPENGTGSARENPESAGEEAGARAGQEGYDLTGQTNQEILDREQQGRDNEAEVRATAARIKSEQDAKDAAAVPVRDNVNTIASDNFVLGQSKSEVERMVKSGVVDMLNQPESNDSVKAKAQAELNAQPDLLAQPAAESHSDNDPIDMRFAKASDGSEDFGEISGDIAKEIGRDSAKIRLRIGNMAEGYKHIQRHLDDIKAVGFDSVETFVEEIAKHFNAIYASGKQNSRALTLVENSWKLKFANIQLEPSADGTFYEIKNASPGRDDQFKNKSPLWGNTGPGVPSAEQTSLIPGAKAGETNIPQESTQGKDEVTKAKESITQDSNLPDGTYIQDGNGNDFRVHYQRNGLVVAHPIIDGKPVVSADTSVRFWVDKKRTPSGDADRTDPVYRADSQVAEAHGSKLTDKGVALYQKSDDNEYYGLTEDEFNKLPRAQQAAYRQAAEAVRVLRREKGSLLANGIAVAFRENGTASLIGRRVSSPQDLAVAAQVYRDPRFETFRYFYIRDGVVVGENAVSSRLPGTSLISPGNPDTYIAQITHEARKVGADAIWVLHNHPSGNPEPSDRDISTTQYLAGRFDKGGIPLAGHVIINHSRYTSMAADGAFDVVTHQFKNTYDLNAHVHGHALLGKKVKDSIDVAEHAKAAGAAQGNIVIIGVAGDQGIRAVMQIEPAMMHPLRAAAILRRFAKSTGSSDIFAYNVPESMKSHVSKAISTNLLVDAVYVRGDGTHLSHIGTYGIEGKSDFVLGKGIKGYRVDHSAWHGSPHDHDRFSTEHIGSGEGAQAYGWGLYFAGSKQVAEWYKNALSRNTLNYNGVKINRNSNIRELFPNATDEFVQVLSDAVSMGIRQGIASYLRQQYEAMRYGATGKRLETARALLKQLKAMEPSLKTMEAQGRLYQVELSPSEDEYLLWDKPLSEQSEKVRNALAKIAQPNGTVEKRGSGWAAIDRDGKVIGTFDYKLQAEAEILDEAASLAMDKRADGDMLYHALVRKTGSKQSASEYLNYLGIRGIKYLDGTSRSRDAGEPQHNYVIFDDADVEITHKESRGNQSKATNPHTVSTLKAAIDAAYSHVKGFADLLIGTGKFHVIEAGGIEKILGGKGDEMLELADMAQRAGNGNKTVEIADVAEWEVKEAKEKAGLDLSGYKHTADMFAIRHALNQHGSETKEGERGQIKLTDTDIASIPIAIVSPDAVIYGAKNNRGMDLVSSIKKMSDGSLLVIEEVRVGRKSLALASARKLPAARDFDSIARTLLSNAQSDGGIKPIIVIHDENKQVVDYNNQDIRYSKEGRILAFVKDGQTYFVADNISQSTDNVKGLIGHEIGVHALQLGKTDAEFQKIIRRFVAMGRMGNQKVKDAQARVPKGTPANLVNEESLGYFIEANPNMPFTKKVIAAFRALLRKIGASIKGADKLRWIKWASKLTDSDIIYMAAQAVRSAPETLGKAKDRGTFKADTQDRFYSQLRRVMRDAPDKVFGSGTQVKLWLVANADTV